MDRRLVLPMIFDRPGRVARRHLGDEVHALGSMADLHPDRGPSAAARVAGVILLWVEDRARVAAPPRRARPRRRSSADRSASGARPTAECGLRPTLSVPSSSPCTTAPGRSIPAPRRGEGARARRSSSSEMTASVLVRRGYARPRARRARFLARRDRARTIRSCSATCARPCERDPRGDRGRQADLRARRLRRRRHLRDRARRPDAARARRRRRLAPAEPLRGGLRRLAARRSRGSPTRAAGSCSRSTAASRPSRRSPSAKALGLEVVVTDHHRPGDDAARLPDRRARGRPTTRSRSSAAPASSTSSRRRCSAPTSARRGTSTSSRSRRSPTSCRSSTRTAALAIAGPARARARRSSPGLRALMRTARRRSGDRRRRRGRLPARAADQRRRPARPSATPRSSCCSPTTRTRRGASPTSSRR